MITARFSQGLSLAIEAHDGYFRKGCFIGIFFRVTRRRPFSKQKVTNKI